ERLELLHNRVFHHDAGFGFFHLAVLHENQGRDGADAEAHREIALGHDIDFGYFGSVTELGGDFVEHGREHLAGAAMLGPEVNDYGDRSLLGFGGKIVAGKMNDGFVGHDA